MKPLDDRIDAVNDAVAEPLPVLAGAGQAAEGFEALYRRSFPKVYAYVAALLRDRAAAEDVTAQAFERAYRRRRSFRASRGNFGLVWVQTKGLGAQAVIEAVGMTATVQQSLAVVRTGKSMPGRGGSTTHSSRSSST